MVVEIENFLEAVHIKRIDRTALEMFSQPVVVTDKKDRSVKITLDARSLKNAILKDKYQMSNLVNLEKIAEKSMQRRSTLQIVGYAIRR